MIRSGPVESTWLKIYNQDETLNYLVPVVEGSQEAILDTPSMDRINTIFANLFERDVSIY